MTEEDDVHEPGVDSLLVLLPESAISPKGIRLLSEISRLDPFIIENSLKLKLPRILCPAHSHYILGTTGDLLEAMGIRFIAVKKNFLDLPFKPFLVSSCRFGKNRSRFYDSRHFPVEIYNEENILLIEGRYDTTDGNVSYMAGNDPVSGPGQKKPVPVFAKDLKPRPFIMLYQVMDPGPLVFIDRAMDYAFLGPAKKLTAMDNFNVVKGGIEKTFCRRIDQAMLRYRYVLAHEQRLDERKTKGFKLKSHKEMIATAISNEAAVNRMSRLLFFNWCKENGWVSRIMPGV